MQFLDQEMTQTWLNYQAVVFSFLSPENEKCIYYYKKAIFFFSAVITFKWVQCTFWVILSITILVLYRERGTYFK